MASDASRFSHGRDVVVVGAGCAGLSCARTLVEAGERPSVLDKARGVGGRCATRRFEGQPVDHGVLFYHGSHPDFLDALERADATRIENWPERVIGEGKPCLPRAFLPHERRIAFVEGMTAFPKSLARGVDVHLETEVRSISLDDGGHFRLATNGHTVTTTDALILALPVEQVRALVAPLPDSKELDGARALLEMLTTEPCLTLIAGYPIDAPVPEWDVLYPSNDEMLLLASHDSRKRVRKHFHAFVFQCTGRFSRRYLDVDPSEWTRLVLAHAADLLGPWARKPQFTHAHRWRFGRANAGALTRPLLLTLPGGQRLGLVGELFDAAQGVEAAFLSGRALARRMLES